MQSIKHPKTPVQPCSPSTPPLCLCQTISLSLTICRIFGLFPITTSHQNGRCVFHASKFWIGWTLVRIVTIALQLAYSTDLLDIFNIMQGKSLHALLSAVIDILYISYLLLLTLTNLIRVPKFVEAFNKFPPLLNEGLMCKSSRQSLRRAQLGVIVIMTFVFFIQSLTLLWLHFSDRFITDVNISMFINRISQNIIFLFYVLIMCFTTIFYGMLACFERLVIYQLKYVPVHPEKGIEETNNRADFLGILSYEICREVHTGPAKLKTMSQVQIIEYLRCLHEEVSLALYTVNTSLDPQLLFHFMMELTVLIVHWYAVIIYFTYKSATPVDMTIHLLNCLFVFLHSFGLWLFLKTANQLFEMMQGLMNFLLEYSTRISTSDEHQQVRLFIEKLKLQRPFTASGIFTVDLSITGPICANILTYVLVALQFDIPKDEDALLSNVTTAASIGT